MKSRATIITEQNTRWAKMQPTRGAEAAAVAKRLVASKSRYQVVEKRTGVPWWVIAVIHEREASQSWHANIAQGDPWDKRSTHEPPGRGPFKSWEDAAYDALVKCAPYASRWSDWSIGGVLALLEEYNGEGYENKGIPSPYLWAGTDQYKTGKYVADGKFSASAVDHQLGCAVMLYEMQKLDSSIKFGTAVQAVPNKTVMVKAKGVIVGGGSVIVASDVIANGGPSWGHIVLGALLLMGLVYIIYSWSVER